MNWTKPNVNYERLYENLGKTYERGAISGIFYESLQNAMDEDASVVRYNYDTKTRTLIIIDNGRGMDKNKLVNSYHGIAESDKDRKGRKKRYGVGASVFPMSCELVKTITKAEDSPLIATIWNMKDGYQFYQLTEDEKKLIQSPTGTVIILNKIREDFLYFKDRNKNRAMEKELKKTIDDFFYLAVLKLRRDSSFDIVFNNNTIIIQPIDSTELTPDVGEDGKGRWALQKDVRVIGLDYKVAGEVYYLEKGSSSKSGIKFTTDKDLGILNRKPYRRFEIPSEIVSRLGGIFVCTYLEEVQLSTRNGFNEKSKTWEEHEEIITKILEPIIKEIIQHRRKRLTKEELKLLSEINKCVEQVIGDLPDFAVFGAISQTGQKSSGAIVAKGSTVATGLKGTMTNGTGSPHIPQSQTSKHKGTVIQGKGTSGKRRGSPPIEFVSDKKKASVYTDEKGKICINIEHKMYIQTQKTPTLHKWYLADLVGTELSSKLPVPEEYQDDVPSIGKYIIMKKKEFADKVTEYWF